MGTIDSESSLDQELFLAIKNGDQRALETLYDRYWFSLYTRAYRILGREDICKDLVQEIFISLWTKAEEKEILNVKYYLFQALKFRCFSELRNAQTAEKHLKRIRQVKSSIEDATENMVNLRDAEEQVQAALKTLPERCRQVFVLSKFENLSNKEIAEKMQISVNTVENQKSKAYRLLRAMLKHILVLWWFFF